MPWKPEEKIESTSQSPSFLSLIIYPSYLFLLMYKSITLQVFPDKPEKRSASRYSSFDSVAMELAYAYSLQVVGSLKSYRSSICLSVATLGELSVVEKFLVSIVILTFFFVPSHSLQVIEPFVFRRFNPNL